MGEIILVTGATGYIGGRLANRLLQEGYQVRCLVRDPQRLQGRKWASQVETITGDVLQPDTLPAALQGVRVAYYLIHSMMGGDDFHERDIEAANNFATAARQAGVQYLIYLGGLGDPQAELSQHLRSRQETGDALRQAGIPVTEFRAAVIVGSGSLSFEIIRYLTERLPMMICPRWVYTRTQPVAIRDVLDYLVAALRTPACVGKIIEIGGADIITYGEMMEGYARARGLRRWMIPVPVLTPRLSSYWVHLVTPIPATIAQPLIQGLVNENIVHDQTAQEFFPNIQPMSYENAVRLALARLEVGDIETTWSDAMVSSMGDAPPLIMTSSEGMIYERRQQIVPAPPEAVFRAFCGIGGDRGWLYMNWAWEIRGWIDRLVGGVGLRRGRRDPDQLRVGDALDFWRVEAIEQDALLRLRAEMIVPGRAWLLFQVSPLPWGGSLLSQTAYFAPKGLSGLLYWYSLYPIHGLIFKGMVRKLSAMAVELHENQATAVTS